MDREPILEIDHLSVSMGSRPVITDLSLLMYPGDAVAIRGDNGSGKTTLLRAVLSLIPRDGGDIRLPGNTEPKNRPDRSGFAVAWVPQESVLHRFPVSAEEVVAVGLAGRRLSASERRRGVAEAMRQTGAGHLAGRCFHRLSGGERQRVSLARCVAQGARLLLLDEPTSGLDRDSRRGLEELTRILVDQGRSLVVVTHEEEMFHRPPWRLYRLQDGALC